MAPRSPLCGITASRSVIPDLVTLLCRVPRLGELAAHYSVIAAAIRCRLDDPQPLPEPTRVAIESLLEELPNAERSAGRLLEDFERQAGIACGWLDEMD